MVILGLGMGQGISTGARAQENTDSGVDSAAESGSFDQTGTETRSTSAVSSKIQRPHALSAGEWHDEYGQTVMQMLESTDTNRVGGTLRDTFMGPKIPHDLKAFCPRYSSQNPEQRKQFWVGFFKTLADMESGFKSTETNTSDSTSSRGLFQISFNDFGQNNCGDRAQVFSQYQNRSYTSEGLLQPSDRELNSTVEAVSKSLTAQNGKRRHLKFPFQRKEDGHNFQVFATHEPEINIKCATKMMSWLLQEKVSRGEGLFQGGRRHKYYWGPLFRSSGQFKAKLKSELNGRVLNGKSIWASCQ